LNCPRQEKQFCDNCPALGGYARAEHQPATTASSKSQFPDDPGRNDRWVGNREAFRVLAKGRVTCRRRSYAASHVPPDANVAALRTRTLRTI